MPNPLKENAIATLAMARRMTLGLAEDIPADKLTHQPTPNCNHTLWILGHLAGVDDFFLSTVGGKPPALPESWKTLFAMGSKPSANAADYPSLDEIKAKLSDRREALIGWYNSLDDAQLAAPLPEPLTGFAPSTGGMPFSVAWHEGLHAGQLTAVRQSLGIKPKIG